MKKLLFLALILLVSCAKNNEETMFTEFKSKEIQESLKTSPNELNFKIESISMVRDIKGLDSIKYFHNKLMEYYKPSETEKDTLTFDFVIKEISLLIDSTQELILLRAKAGRSYENYESKEQRNDLINQKVYLVAWKSESEEYAKNKNEILSTEYKVKYSLDNPLLKINQNFTSKFYSNKENTKVIQEIKD